MWILLAVLIGSGVSTSSSMQSVVYDDQVTCNEAGVAFVATIQKSSSWVIPAYTCTYK